MPHPRLIFMGTPQFAVPSLEILLAHQYEVAAVVTAPDKPRGRGQKIMPSPVKVAAQKHQLPVLQPTQLKAPAFLELLQHYQAQLYVVVAFRMLPSAIWKLPQLGTINLHASLLPAYRGAAPINWAIIQGETETGLTTFLIEEKMDTGHILFQAQEPIHPQDTAGTLHDRLQHKGARLLLKTVQAIAQNNYAPIAQNPTPAELNKKAPKIHKADCQINWHQDAPCVINHIRGLSPYPAAWATLQGQPYKILAAEIANDATPMVPGQLHTDNKHYIHIGTRSQPIALRLLQPAGKKVMEVSDFLRGNQLQDSSTLAV